MNTSFYAVTAYTVFEFLDRGYALRTFRRDVCKGWSKHKCGNTTREDMASCGATIFERDMEI